MYKGGHQHYPSRGSSNGPLDPVRQVVRWLKARSGPEKVGLSVLGGILVSRGLCRLQRGSRCFQLITSSHAQVLVLLYFIIEDHDYLFILSEACHLIGLGILLFKLQQKQSAAGALSGYSKGQRTYHVQQTIQAWLQCVIILTRQCMQAFHCEHRD
jgi:hypothetical protein